MVAIKVMVLPARMSGAEKRERMVSGAGRPRDDGRRSCRREGRTGGVQRGACGADSEGIKQGTDRLDFVDAAAARVGVAALTIPCPCAHPLTCTHVQAVMETAISSVLQHPNIVQTYTYTIKRSTCSHMAMAE